MRKLSNFLKPTQPHLRLKIWINSCDNLLESNKITKEASIRLKILDAQHPGYTDYQNYTKKTSLSDP